MVLHALEHSEFRKIDYEPICAATLTPFSAPLVEVQSAPFSAPFAKGAAPLVESLCQSLLSIASSFHDAAGFKLMRNVPKTVSNW